MLSSNPLRWCTTAAWFDKPTAAQTTLLQAQLLSQVPIQPYPETSVLCFQHKRAPPAGADEQHLSIAAGPAE
jgi:hypothetical protein